MFYPGVVVVCSSYTGVFIWGLSLPRIDAVCVCWLMGMWVCFPPHLCTFYLGVVLCLVCGGHETDGSMSRIML
jgi:hypothetical protein